MALMLTLYNHIYSFLYCLDLMILANVKLVKLHVNVSWQKKSPFELVDFIGVPSFEWHS